MKYGKRPIEHVSVEDILGSLSLRDSNDHMELKNLKKIDHTRSGYIVDGDSPEEKAGKLFELYLKGWLEKQ